MNRLQPRAKQQLAQWSRKRKKGKKQNLCQSDSSGSTTWQIKFQTDTLYFNTIKNIKHPVTSSATHLLLVRQWWFGEYLYYNYLLFMDLPYVPHSNDIQECNFLQKNFITCLKEKSLKDQVPKMECNVEYILWFNLECPERFSSYTDQTKLRSKFMQVKSGKDIEQPKFVKI